MNTLHLVSISSVLLTLVVRADHLVLVAGGGAKEDDAPAIETKLTAPFGDPAIYASAGWGYHQGPTGGGVAAVIARV